MEQTQKAHSCVQRILSAYKCKGRMNSVATVTISRILYMQVAPRRRGSPPLDPHPSAAPPRRRPAPPRPHPSPAPPDPHALSSSPHRRLPTPDASIRPRPPRPTDPAAAKPGRVCVERRGRPDLARAAAGGARGAEAGRRCAVSGAKRRRPACPQVRRPPPSAPTPRRRRLQPSPSPTPDPALRPSAPTPRRPTLGAPTPRRRDLRLLSPRRAVEPPCPCVLILMVFSEDSSLIGGIYFLISFTQGQMVCHSQSIDELQRLLKDKEAYNAFFNSLDQVKTQDNVRDEIRKETLQLARENLEKEQRILELRNQCAIIRTTELAAAQDRLTDLERQKDEIMKSYSPAALLDKLHRIVASAVPMFLPVAYLEFGIHYMPISFPSATEYG